MEAIGCASGHAVGSGYRPESGDRRVLLTRPRRVHVGGDRFSDDGHVRYYVRCGGKTVEEKKKKMMKNLTRDLSLLMRMEGENTNKETMDALLVQLDELNSKKKLMKKEKEEKKAMKKMMKMKSKEEKAMKKMKDCVDDMSSSSSSESSESSDSECDEVVDSASLKTGVLIRQNDSTISPVDLVLSETKDKTVTQIPGPLTGASVCNTDSPTSKGLLITDSLFEAGAVLPSAKIEVCMGGKCKKSGALQLKAEFEKMVGSEGAVAVVGCKCMGKCKEGPNVRVVIQCGEGEVLGPLQRNPLCIGVGLDDVGAILSNYLDKNDMGLMAA